MRQTDKNSIAEPSVLFHSEFSFLPLLSRQSSIMFKSCLTVPKLFLSLFFYSTVVILRFQKSHYLSEIVNYRRSFEFSLSGEFPGKAQKREFSSKQPSESLTPLLAGVLFVPIKITKILENG